MICRPIAGAEPELLCNNAVCTVVSQYMLLKGIAACRRVQLKMMGF